MTLSCTPKPQISDLIIGDFVQKVSAEVPKSREDGQTDGLKTARVSLVAIYSSCVACTIMPGHVTKSNCS